MQSQGLHQNQYPNKTEQTVHMSMPNDNAACISIRQSADFCTFVLLNRNIKTTESVREKKKKKVQYNCKQIFWDSNIFSLMAVNKQ